MKLKTFQAPSIGHSRQPPDDSDDPTVDESTWLPRGQMTGEELYACQVALKIRHNWSDQEFYNQMQVISATFPTEPEFPKSLYYSKLGLKELCTFAPTYVVYCREHLEIVDRSKVKIKEATCPHGESLTESLEQGDLQFITVPIKDQIESFAKEENFRHTVRNFSRLVESHMRGLLHGDNIQKMHFDLTLYMDGSQLHRKTGNLSLPAYLVFNNIPVNYQVRYPILAAIFAGKKKHLPPRDIFLRDMVTELNHLADNPIDWVDDLEAPVKSEVKMSTFTTDAEEKSDVMGHVHHGGFFSCHFCITEGITLTKAAYEHLFRSVKDFPLKKTKISKKDPDTIPGGPRYPKTIWKEKCPIRDGKERIDKGVKAMQKQVELGNPKYSLQGIRATPAIMDLKHFDETNSHVADTLHGICHGIFKDIITKMMDGSGKEHNFARNAKRDFTNVDRLQETLTRTSEIERNCYPLSQFDKWNAYDEFQFILHSTALLCSDYEILPSNDVYAVLVRLANVVYLAHHGRPTEQIITKLEDELKEFCKLLKKTFGEEYCTHKFHVMQHMPRFMRLHGSSYWTDGWNMERLNLFTRSLTNASNNELSTIVRNFLIKHHGTVFKNIKTFQPKVQKILHSLGVDTTIFGYKYVDKVIKEHEIQSVPRHVKDVFIEQAVKENICTPSFAEQNLKRIKSIIRKGVILESKEVTHQPGSKVRDSYIQVKDEHFGEIEEIFSIKEENNTEAEHFIIMLRKFKHIRIKLYDTNAVIQYPINQFPYVRPMTTNGNLLTFVLKENTFIQKGQIAELKYPNDNELTRLYIVSPNDAYHF